MKIRGKLLRFGDPVAADIVIFDDEGSQHVRKALNQKYSVAVFNMRPEDIWIGTGVAFNFLRLITKFHFREAIKNGRGFVRGAKSQLWFIYLEACLVTMQPKAVVTFIDNDNRFHWLSKRCREFPFIAIQNGFRPRPHSCDTNDYSNYYLQHLFCMGSHAIDSFPRMGYRVENFYPVGSLLASLYFDHKQAGLAEKYDLLVVSTWRGNIGYRQDVQDTMRSMKTMDLLLAKYIKERGLKAAVILRSERNSSHWVMPEVGLSEEAYYREIYGKEIEIIDVDFSKERNIYPVMQQSKVIVSCLCSALLEALRIGKKVLYCNFTGADWYYQDLPSSLITDESTYASLAKRLDGLRQMSQAEYLKINQENQRYYMSAPEDKPTYQVIAGKIDQIIKNFELRRA